MSVSASIASGRVSQRRYKSRVALLIFLPKFVNIKMKKFIHFDKSQTCQTVKQIEMPKVYDYFKEVDVI